MKNTHLFVAAILTMAGVGLSPAIADEAPKSLSQANANSSCHYAAYNNQVQNLIVQDRSPTATDNMASTNDSGDGNNDYVTNVALKNPCYGVEGAKTALVTPTAKNGH
jgi:hypothetical protein